MVDLPLNMLMHLTDLTGSSGEVFLILIFFDGNNVHKIVEFVLYKMDFSVPHCAWWMILVLIGYFF
jgi:hypothetical protein